MSGGHSRSRSGLKRSWSIVSTIAVCLVLAGAVALLTLRILGCKIFTVTSGSMEPNLPVGSLIFAMPPRDASNLQAGDIITFMNDENTVVTHRIVEVVEKADETTGEVVTRYRTKGDANNTNDGKLVHYKNVVGTPAIVIPFVGYISYYLQRPPGLYIALVICTILVCLIIIPYVNKPKPKRKEQTVEVLNT